eukprot:g5292.t1
MERSSAKKRFAQAVQQQVQLLVAQGEPKPEAVKHLLRRICDDSSAPPAADVEEAMRAQKLSRLDATHALIVKGEISRLRSRGFDAISAIEELTAKLQGARTSSPARHRAPAATEAMPAGGASAGAGAAAGRSQVKRKVRLAVGADGRKKARAGET